MKQRQNLTAYALEAIPRPGSRETRVKRAPDAMPIRNRRGSEDER